MVAAWIETWKSTVKRRAGAITLCVGLVAVLFGHSHEVQAQTWLPAPPAVDCRPPSERFRPNPPQSDQAFTFITGADGGVLDSYHLQIVGNELRLYARSQDAGLTQPFRCYEIPVAAGSLSPGRYHLVRYGHGALGTPGQYALSPLITTLTSFDVVAAPIGTPINARVALLFLIPALFLVACWRSTH